MTHQQRTIHEAASSGAEAGLAPSPPTESAEAPEAPGVAHLASSGHRIEVSTRASTVRIRNAEGRVELTVRCTAEGCVLEFATADIALSAPGKLSLDCDEFAIEARRGVALNTQGDWTSQIAGHSVTRVGGRAEVHADELELNANRGDALVRANDRVRVVGEQILLNSELDGQASRDQLEAFWRSLGL
jgi:hypothetical protein